MPALQDLSESDVNIEAGGLLRRNGEQYRITLPLFDVWATTENGTVVLAANTREVPDLPQWNSDLVEPPKPRIDGRWGLSEYALVPQIYNSSFPYLAWMPTRNFQRLGIPTQINRFRIFEEVASVDSVFVRHSGWQHRGHLRTDLREELQKDVIFYINQVDEIIRTEANSSSRLGAAEVRPPVIALVRAHNSAFCMRFPHLTYRDLLEYLAGLQRSVGELQGYSMWYDRIHYGDIPTSNRSFEMGLRGSIAESSADYDMLRKLGAPVWLELPLSHAHVLDPKKEVHLTRLSIERRTWAEMTVDKSLRDMHNGKLVRNKPLEYYPPSVDDLVIFELAARGYSPRTDVLLQDNRSARDVLSMVATVG
ncbi:hypothetical protein B0H10DRAFT_1948014 [Mycena sp. CBHHK59/15]|nr:hypothetical protein B0H10DRAFT_1948014 [Mycena sp. CBHHK59/15]